MDLREFGMFVEEPVQKSSLVGHHLPFVVNPSSPEGPSKPSW
jgi:hypothetical protein